MAQDTGYPFYPSSRDMAQDMYASRNFNRQRMDPPPLPHLDPQLAWSSNERPAQSPAFSDIPLSPSPGTYDEPMPAGILEASSRPGDVESDPNPLRRFYTTPGPWSSQDIALPPTELRYTTPSQPVARPAPAFAVFRDPPRSDPGSHFTGGLPDSGYGTRSHVTSSVFSDHIQDHSHETQSLTGGMGGIHLQQDHMPQGRPHRHSSASQPLGYTTAATEPSELGGPIALKCEIAGCNVQSKNASDQRKHQQRHLKPFICTEPQCPRHLQGFTTKNDLERHKKTVHSILPDNASDRSFKCAGAGCPKKDKIWPRMDNFKSHCNRIHATENVDELVKKSEIDSPKELLSNLSGAGPYRRPKAEEGPNLALVPYRPPDDLSSKHSSSDPFKDPSTGSATTEGRQHRHRMSPALLDGQGQRPTKDHPSPWPSGSRQAGNGKPGWSAATLQQPIEQAAGDGEGTDAVADVLRRSGASIGQSMPGVNGCTAGLEEISKAIADQLAASAAMNEASSSKEIQGLIRAQLFSLFNHANPRKRQHDDAPPNDAAQPKAKRVTCRSCPKTMDRPCDLKKHEKRHSRPWGCTYSNCTKRFGSKNDWKRHENSQHYQLETWRCHEPKASSKINQCAELFYRRDPFLAHLRKDHSSNDEEHIREQCRKGRIGRNGQGAFWCGFCKQVIALKSRGLEAWDERSNHIDDLHFKHGRRIEEWYPLDKDIPKGQQKGQHEQGRRGPAMETSDSEESDWGGRHRHDSPGPPPSPPPPTAPSYEETPFMGASQGSSSRRSPVPDAPPKKQKRTHSMWYCCTCQQGPYNAAFMPSCLWDSCNHSICSSCPREME